MIKPKTPSRSVGALSRLAGLGVLIVSTMLVAPWTAASPIAQPTAFAQDAGRDGAFSFAAIADLGGTRRTDAVLTSVSDANPAFALAMGDLSYDVQGPESRWCGFVTSRVGNTFPFEIVAGNREDDSINPSEPLAGNIDRFAECLPDRMSNTIGTYAREYYFDYPPSNPLARVIMISPGLSFEDGLWNYTQDSPHYAWLSGAIDSARAAGIPWVVTAMHKPCLSMGTQRCGTGSGIDLLNLLLAKRVDLVMNGHDHTYQRSKQLASDPQACPRIAPKHYDAGCLADSGDGSGGYAKGRGTVFVTAGTGGQSILDVNPSDADAPYFASWMGNNSDPTFGWLSVNVAARELNVKFVPASGGSFSDTFSIVAPPD